MTLERWDLVGKSIAIALACASPSLAGERPPTAAVAGPSPAIARPEAPPRPTRSGPSGDSGAWWLGSAGIAAALAVFGGVSLASKRFSPLGRDSGPIQVVGRSALSARHGVYLLRVGDRVLIVGTGPQGPPSSLGEVTDPAELARLIPRRAPTAPTPPPSRIDRRIGDDE